MVIVSITTYAHVTLLGSFGTVAWLSEAAIFGFAVTTALIFVLSQDMHISRCSPVVRFTMSGASLVHALATCVGLFAATSMSGAFNGKVWSSTFLETTVRAAFPLPGCRAARTRCLLRCDHHGVGLLILLSQIESATRNDLSLVLMDFMSPSTSLFTRAFARMRVCCCGQRILSP